MLGAAQSASFISPFWPAIAFYHIILLENRSQIRQFPVALTSDGLLFTSWHVPGSVQRVFFDPSCWLELGALRRCNKQDPMVNLHQSTVLCRNQTSEIFISTFEAPQKKLLKKPEDDAGWTWYLDWSCALTKKLHTNDTKPWDNRRCRGKPWAQVISLTNSALPVGGELVGLVVWWRRTSGNFWSFSVLKA